MTITLTHPTDPTKTWTSGFRGKRPNWVKDILAANPNMLPSKEKEGSAYVPVEDNTPRLRYWKWKGLEDLEDEDSRITTRNLCVVGGMTPEDAMKRLNKTFSTPVMPTEWATCWKEIDPANVTILGGKVGVFEKMKDSIDWIERKEKAFGSKA